MRISDWSSDVCSSDLAPETAMLARCGDALADVLTGRARALDLLFAAAEPGDAGAVYAGSRYAGALNGLAVAAVERAVGERTGFGSWRSAAALAVPRGICSRCWRPASPSTVSPTSRRPSCKIGRAHV